MLGQARAQFSPDLLKRYPGARLVVFIRQACLRGMATIDAKQAGRARFRPILLASITTVAGLTPLLLEKSLQAQILMPLAASLAFGLVTATIAALFMVPAVYVILDDFGALGALEGEADELVAGGRLRLGVRTLCQSDSGTPGGSYLRLRCARLAAAFSRSCAA